MKGITRRCSASLMAVALAATTGGHTRQADAVAWFRPDPAAGLVVRAGMLALERTVDEYLIEDSGGAPGGHEDITGRIAVRKTFDIGGHVPLGEISTSTVEILLFEAPGNQAPLLVTFNGTATKVPAGSGAAGKYEWRSVPVPPGLLRSGSNVVTLATAYPVETAAWAVLTRRSTFPNRSARSLDGGISWVDEGLGTDGSENGEYTIRLRLSAPAMGTAFSPVLPLRADTSTVVAPANREGDYAVRTGPLAVPDSRWTSWQVPGETGWVKPRDHDFVQTSVRLVARGSRSRLPIQPVIFGRPEITDITARVNAWLPYGSRVRYQEPDHAALQLLRTRERLDDLVQGLGEEASVWKLRDWARQQFPDGDPNPYPPLNATTILNWIRSGLTQGFCGQHAYVLGQALLSFGYQVRYIELGMNTPTATGEAYFPAVHFALEYWSPLRRQWTYVDPNKNLHITLNGRPLSAREVHDIYIDYFDLPMRSNPELTPFTGDPARVSRRPREIRTQAGVGQMRVDGWDLEGRGRLEVLQGPAEGGRWSLEHFYYVRARLRNDELMHASQSPSDLAALSPRNPDGFNPNGMLEFEDPRCRPLQEKIALYETRSPSEFDWSLDVMDVRSSTGQLPLTIQAAANWPHVRSYRLVLENAVHTSPEGTFTLSRELRGTATVEALDSAGRVVAVAEVRADRKHR